MGPGATREVLGYGGHSPSPFLLNIRHYVRVADRRFAWGDEVRVLSRDGQSASVCAVTETQGGGWRYLVEFDDGSSVEVGEDDLTAL